MFLVACVVRIGAFADARFIAERQFRSALIARAFYLEHVESVPEWRREVARVSKRRMGRLEPPIMEHIVATGYRLVGGEHLWIARMLATAFWLTGGGLLFALLSRLVSVDAALYGTVYYLFVPMGVHVSISFLPDSLMIALFIGSLLTIVRYSRASSWGGLILAGLVSGLCVLTKPLCLFAIVGGFVALRIEERSVRRALLDSHSYVFVSFVLLPACAYYVYGIFSGGYLAQQAQSIAPGLLLHPGFWTSWLRTAVGVVGAAPLLLAMAGVLLLRAAFARTMSIGLWVGYVIFCLVFSYHIRFAGYYHTQLTIIVALTLGPAVALVVDRAVRAPMGRLRWVPLVGALLLVTFVGRDAIRRRLTAQRSFDRPEVAREIGELVGHSTRTVYVAPYYGIPLEYYGELSGIQWPRQASDVDRALRGREAGVRSVEERLRSLRREIEIRTGGAETRFTPEYFVITDFREFERHHDDLRAYLTGNCQRVAENDRYIIYGSCGS
jgi:4-amino-4-deoxy-L-arabinose transferase-like glycosyltransferase